MALTLLKSGEKSLINARRSSQLIEQRKLCEANSALIKAGMGVAKHIHEITQLIERYTAVQKFYMEREDILTKKIGDIHKKEKAAQSKKSSAELELRLQRKTLYLHERNLDSARESLNLAERRHKENNMGTVLAGTKAVAATLATLCTLGIAAPITVPLVAEAVEDAIDFDHAANEAENEMRRAEHEIRDTKHKISDYESAISSLNNTIYQLNRDESRYREDRCHLEKEKGQIREVIAFLLDAEKYGYEYSDTAQACSQRTTLVKKVVSTAERKGYSLFDSNGTERILTSFEEAWETFEEMNEKGQSYVFTIDFQCSQCNCSRNEFPYISSGKLICAGCFEYKTIV